MYKPLTTFLVFTFFFCSGAGAQADDVFVERFESNAPGERWHVESTHEPPCLRWHEKGEKPGFHFKSVAVPEYMTSHGHAWAEWEVGTRAFELEWDVHLDRGLRQQWFNPGVVVALTSAPPGRMEDEDIAVAFSAKMAGPTAEVRRGGLYKFRNANGKKAYAGFQGRRLSDLIPRGGGRVASVEWPHKQLDGAALTFRLERTEENKVRFTLSYHNLPAGRGDPFWTGTWKMPAEVAEVPLRYVVVKRIPVKSTHISYRGFVMQGTVSNIQGRLKSAASAPVVERYTPGRPVLGGGAELVLRGDNFQRGCWVSVGGRSAGTIRVESSSKLTCSLPELPYGKRHPLTVINPSGLAAELKRGVAYGRMIEEVRPREALPEGRDIVSVLGAGFEEETVFLFGDSRAEVVERVSAEQVRVRVPAGDIGRAEVSARTGEKAFSGDPLFGYSPHPYLFFRTQDVPGLRRKFRDPRFRDYSQRAMREANARLDEEIGGDFNASVGATTSLAFAYVFTGQGKYRDKLMDWVRHGWQATRYDDFHLMSVAGMSIAYDILYPELAHEERAAFQTYLDRMLGGYLKETRGSWFLGGSYNFSNTVPVGNSGGMLAGLALMHSTPRAKRAVDIAARKAMIYPEQCITPDGACREGVQYWDFGTSFHLILAHALNNATGDDRGLLDHQHLRRNVNFIRTTLGGHGGQFAFNDTREPWLGGYAICSDLGSRYEQPLMLWVADLCARGGRKTRARDIWAPFAFLWRSEQPAPEEFPGVPTLAYLESIHWGAMRSDDTFKPGLVVGVKGSRGPLTHHKQNDLGSYVVHANGEAYLVDPGYYEGKATDHTLPLVDGQGPDVTGASITQAYEKGPWRTMTLNSTDGYGKAARSVRRLVVMHGETSIVVLDDIVPAKGNPGKITAQYQTGWTPKIDGKNGSNLIITGQNGRLELRTFGHDLGLSAEDRRFSSGWHWKKIDQNGPGDWHSVSGVYTADPTRPLITVLRPAEVDAELTHNPECIYDQDKIVVRPHPDYEVRFVRREGRWKVLRP